MVGIGGDDGKQKGEYSAIFYNTDKNSKNYLKNGHLFGLFRNTRKSIVGWGTLSLERILHLRALSKYKHQKTIWVFKHPY